MGLLEIIDYTSRSIDKWHADSLTWFDYDEEVTDDIACYVRKQAYHNYCNWHYTENYNQKEPNYLGYIWDGGLAHNRDRNLYMQKIDEYYVSVQVPCSTYNSEGLGSVLDRYSNDYIKFLHMTAENDERAPLMLPQIEFLKNIAVSLENDLLNGNRNIIVFKKFKSKGYEHLCEAGEKQSS